MSSRSRHADFDLAQALGGGWKINGQEADEYASEDLFDRVWESIENALKPDVAALR